jgi:hypothetical protein
MFWAPEPLNVPRNGVASPNHVRKPSSHGAGPTIVVRRIDCNPMHARSERLDPGVRGKPCNQLRSAGDGLHRIGFDVAAHIARRKSGSTQNAEHQMREVLADAGPLLQRLTRAGSSCGLIPARTGTCRRWRGSVVPGLRQSARHQGKTCAPNPSREFLSERPAWAVSSQRCQSVSRQRAAALRRRWRRVRRTLEGFLSCVPSPG